MASLVKRWRFLLMFKLVSMNMKKNFLWLIVAFIYFYDPLHAKVFKLTSEQIQSANPLKLKQLLEQKKYEGNVFELSGVTKSLIKNKLKGIATEAWMDQVLSGEQFTPAQQQQAGASMSAGIGAGGFGAGGGTGVGGTGVPGTGGIGVGVGIGAGMDLGGPEAEGPGTGVGTRGPGIGGGISVGAEAGVGRGGAGIGGTGVPGRAAPVPIATTAPGAPGVPTEEPKKEEGPSAFLSQIKGGFTLRKTGLGEKKEEVAPEQLCKTPDNDNATGAAAIASDMVFLNALKNVAVIPPVTNFQLALKLVKKNLATHIANSTYLRCSKFNTFLKDFEEYSNNNLKSKDANPTDEFFNGMAQKLDNFIDAVIALMQPCVFDASRLNDARRDIALIVVSIIESQKKPSGSKSVSDHAAATLLKDFLDVIKSKNGTQESWIDWLFYAINKLRLNPKFSRTGLVGVVKGGVAESGLTEKEKMAAALKAKFAVEPILVLLRLDDPTKFGRPATLVTALESLFFDKANIYLEVSEKELLEALSNILPQHIKVIKDRAAKSAVPIVKSIESVADFLGSRLESAKTVNDIIGAIRETSGASGPALAPDQIKVLNTILNQLSPLKIDVKDILGTIGARELKIKGKESEKKSALEVVSANLAKIKLDVLQILAQLQKLGIKQNVLDALKKTLDVYAAKREIPFEVIRIVAELKAQALEQRAADKNADLSPLGVALIKAIIKLINTIKRSARGFNKTFIR